MLVLLMCQAYGQTPDNPEATTVRLRTEQLLEIQSALSAAEETLKTLKKTTAKTTQERDPELFTELGEQNAEVESLQRSLEKMAAGGLTMQAINAEEPAFDWRQELASITQPVIESLKKLTSKPRQTAELHATLERIESQQQLLQKGLVSIERENQAAGGIKDARLKTSLNAIQQKWQQQLTGLAREQAVILAQLESLDQDTLGWQELLSQTLDSFVAGHALTLFLAILSAAAIWLLFRLINRSLWNHQSTRRSSPLYRLLMYGFHAFSTIFIVFSIFTVFYLRDDILLLGIGVIVLLGGLISLQRTLPRFIREVNLLLNLGSAREGERVIYHGVPYRIQSLNVFTTLSNPALAGIQRLPLEQVGSLYSRPELPDESWFPSQTGDTLLLADQRLVTVEQQNVEQVILKTLGGTLIQYKTAAFLELNVENLSRNGTFVVATVFGLDYRYQPDILDHYPALIRAGVEHALEAGGIEAAEYRDVNVEFRTANASSLDLQVWATFDSSLARRYRKLERLLQQACVRVCNQYGLNIPFPQLALHVEKVAPEAPAWPSGFTQPSVAAPPAPPSAGAFGSAAAAEPVPQS
ncbi:MAG: mechanosensitive ion channel family protein [Thiothrix sp.]|nr:mechanosensitive ion channel family protein [Thiothrix sp.]HPQ95484.1 mechanosensitive ion channel family protein [Thiolinea sp.]